MSHRVYIYFEKCPLKTKIFVYLRREWKILSFFVGLKKKLVRQHLSPASRSTGSSTSRFERMVNFGCSESKILHSRCHLKKTHGNLFESCARNQVVQFNDILYSGRLLV